MDPLTFALIGLGLLGATAIVCRRRREDEVLREMGIRNAKGEFPYLIKKKISDLKSTLIFGLPDGIDGKKLLAGGKWNHMLLQSFGEMKHTEISLLDGHRLAVIVYHAALPDTVPFEFKKGKALSIPVGASLKGPVVLELGDAAPHVGVAGTTGGGKSTLLRVIITWLAMHGVTLYLTDLKGGIEQQLFAACRSVKSCDKTVEEGLATLKVLVKEMERRISLLYDRSATHYTAIGLPPIVLVIDELADYEDTPQAMEMLTELGRKSRATGIITISATQRPESAVMKGSYKANVPAWFCFRMRDHINSQIVLGHAGAELLPGKGRCIFASSAGEVEMQGAYLSAEAAMKLLEPTYVKKLQLEMDTSGVLN